MTLKATAVTILRLIEAGEYVVDDRIVRFSMEQAKARAGTRIYTPDQLATIAQSIGATPKIRVVDGTSQAVALELTGESFERVGLLNFASARNPGGGFLNGAKAQEEDLCRCSGLYPCLLQCMEYYEANRQQTSLLYTDYAIFSPDVPFFKTRGTGDLLREPYYVSVVTAPAPNSGPFLRSNPDALDDLERTFLRRWRNVLRIARHQGIECLLLGAWGCGAFGGDSNMASRTAKEAIALDGNGIKEIVFAIPSSGRQSKVNLEGFRSTFM